MEIATVVFIASLMDLFPEIQTWRVFNMVENKILRGNRLDGRSEVVRHSEGGLAKAIEEQTAKLPSDLFLWAAGGSILWTFALKTARKDHQSLFVGQWVAPFLILGLYNKLVKVAGSDRTSR